MRPADFERVVDLVTPELRRRGLLPEAGEEPKGLTLREAPTGGGPHLPIDHLGTRFKRGTAKS